MNRRLCKISAQLILILVFLLSGVISARAQSDQFEPNVEAEKLIVQLLSSGKIADLSLDFPDEADRVISAEFLENLLTGKIISIPGQEIVIDNVRIEGSISLTNKVFQNISINQCVFAGTVDLQGSKFENLTFSSCTFLEDVNFQKIAVYDLADFNNSNFDGNVDFSLVDMGSINLESVHLNNAGVANFDSIDVKKNASVDLTVFNGPVDFGYARVGGNIDFDNTQFNSTGESNFNSIEVGEAAFFRNATFSGSIDFGHSRMGTNLEFSGAKFNSKDRLLFNSMEIPGSVLFQDAVFSGPVFFLYSNIGNLGDFSRAQFASSFVASFSFLNIERGVIFEGASFSGPTNFSHLDSGGSLDFQDAKFIDSNNTIVFTDIDVKGDFQLKDASFAGGLLINNLTVKNAFIGENVVFLNPRESINIGQIEAQTLSLLITAFPASVSITNCSFMDYYLKGTGSSLAYSSVNLSGTKIMRNFLISDFTVQSFVASNFMSFGRGRVENINIQNYANLNFSSFNVLIFQNVSWPTIPGNLELDGFNYQEILPGEGLSDNNWHELLDLINKSNYNNALYRNLEAYFEERGRSDWGDQVLIAQKKRERSELLKWYTVKWWWNLFLEVFISYGKKPGRAFLWSFIIVLIGSLVFKKERMIPDGEVSESYDSFWYSLDLFIPYIDMGMTSKWKPSPEATKLLIYRRVHLILGWLVLPIALFSVSGLIK